MKMEMLLNVFVSFYYYIIYNRIFNAYSTCSLKRQKHESVVCLIMLPCLMSTPLQHSFTGRQKTRGVHTDYTLASLIIDQII